MENDLDNIYHNYKKEISKVRFIGLTNFISFYNFPVNLSPIVNNTVNQTISKVKNHIENPKEKQVPTTGLEGAFLVNYFDLVGENIELKSLDFEQIGFRQEIILYTSYLEAYFQDIKRFLYKKDKTLLKYKDRSLSWKEIVELDDLDSIYNKMISDKLIRSKTPNESVEELKRPNFSIPIKLKRKQIDILKKIDLIRNIIVHNNARISPELIEFCPKENLKENDTYHLTSEFLLKTYDFTKWTIFQTFAAVKVKFFNADLSELHEKYQFVEGYEFD